MTDLSGDQCDRLLDMETIVQEDSDPLEVDCLDELEKMIKAESIIKMEEHEEVEFISRQQDDPLDLAFSAEEKMDSYNHFMSNPLQSGISSQLIQSVQGDPLYVKEGEEELLEVKIEEEEDRPCQNISGPPIKNVQHNQNIPERTSHIPIQNLVKSMFNQAEAAKLVQTFSTAHLKQILKQKQKFPDSLHVAKLIRSQKMTQSIHGGPLYLYIKEEEEELKVEKDSPCKNISGPTIKYVQNRLIPKRPSCLAKQNSLNSMDNQADQLVPAFSSVLLKKKVTPGSLHVAELRSPKLPVPKVVLVTQPKSPNIKRGTSILKSDSGNLRQPDLNMYAAEAPQKHSNNARNQMKELWSQKIKNIYAAEAVQKYSKNSRNQMKEKQLLRQSNNRRQKVFRDKLTKDMNMLRDKLAHIWCMNNVPTVTVLEMARDYCILLQQQVTQLKMDQQVEEAKNSCLKRRLVRLTCSQSSMPVEEVPWEEKIKIENVYSTVLRFK